MKESPILFSAPMVRAILNSSKTQTRRAAKLTCAAHVKEIGGHRRWHPSDPEARLACPYGQPGDRLWVRETWAYNPDFPGLEGLACYRADKGHEYDGLKWKPSIHMPYAASRIKLEITGVRVERLQEISAEDALAEGITLHPDHHNRPRESRYGPVETYKDLWESINGTDSWAANPWVWIIEFKRVSP